MSANPDKLPGYAALTRTLKLEILSDNSQTWVPAQPNSREPIPFETEFFKGHAMLVVRTNPVDPLFQSFFNGKRQFEVQVQGKFKRDPQGEIYVGAETSNKMELGILTRSISKAALKFCGTMVNDLHYSFGDVQTNPDYELPHVVAPIFPTLDKILITPDGEQPPPLGVPFNEDLDYRKKRLKYRFIKDANVNLNTTYSFSVNTSNLDLLAWTLVGIPMVRPMDMRTFFGNSSIQLIAYEIPRTVAGKFPNSHPRRLLNYVFSMRLTPVDPDAMPLYDLPLLSSEGEEEPDALPEPEPEEDGELKPSTSKDGGRPEDLGASQQEESEEEALEAEGRDTFSQGVEDGASATPKRGGVSSWFRKKFKRNAATTKPMKNKTSSLSGTTEELLVEAIDVKEAGECVDPDFDLEALGDLQFCPACIELNDHKRDHRRRRFYYMLTIHQLLKANNDPNLSANHDQLPVRLKTYSEIQKSSPIALLSIPKMHKNKKLSALEKRRRQIVESYRTALKAGGSSPETLKQLKTFLLPITEVDNSFLGGNITLYEKYDAKSREIISWEGHMALALSRRHFTEQYMVVTREAIFLRKNQDTKKNNLVIKCDAIVSVHSLPVEYCPIPEFSILQVETYPRVYYFLLRSNLQINQWLEVFITLLGNKCMNSPYRMIDFSDRSHINHTAPALVPTQAPAPSSALPAPPTSPGNRPQQQQQPPSSPATLPGAQQQLYSVTAEQQVESVYYERPACLKADKRRIYNYRRIFFTATVGERYAGIHPNDLMVSILKTAFFLAEAEHTATEYDWVKFWDEISMLQCIDLRRLSEVERTAFFLDLYHVMVIHGALIFGPPNTGIWNAFFSNICYLVSFESVSISEMEYCILRAGMAKTSIFSGMVIASPPQTIFPGLALAHRDFRLHFAINNGSLSLVDTVPVYSPGQLDWQLDENTRLAVDSCVEIDFGKKLVILPKLPFSDYSAAGSSSAGNPDDPAALQQPGAGEKLSSAAHTAASASTKTPGNPNAAAPVSSYSSSVLDCLKALLPYLPKNKQQLLVQLLQDPQHINVKFHKMNFRCRLLKKAP